MVFAYDIYYTLLIMSVLKSIFFSWSGFRSSISSSFLNIHPRILRDCYLLCAVLHSIPCKILSWLTWVYFNVSSHLNILPISNTKEYAVYKSSLRILTFWYPNSAYCLVQRQFFYPSLLPSQVIQWFQTKIFPQNHPKEQLENPEYKEEGRCPRCSELEEALRKASKISTAEQLAESEIKVTVFKDKYEEIKSVMQENSDHIYVIVDSVNRILVRAEVDLKEDIIAD